MVRDVWHSNTVQSRFFFQILQIFAALESLSVKSDPVFPAEHRINQIQTSEQKRFEKNVDNNELKKITNGGVSRSGR